MKKLTLSLLFTILLGLTLSGCQNQPECDNEDAKSLAKDLIKQELKSPKNKIALSMLGIDEIESRIDDFVDNIIEFDGSRPSEIDKELKKCDCTSQIIFKIPVNVTNLINEKLGKDNLNAIALNDVFNSKINFDYTLQLANKDDELFIEAYIPEKELSEILSNYLVLKKAVDKLEKNGNLVTDNNLSDENESTPMTFNTNEIEDVKKWINVSIFKSNVELDYEQTILSEKYKEFLKDASAYIWGGDSNLTEQQVKDKWSKEYDIYKIDNFSLCGNGLTGKIKSNTRFVKIKDNHIMIFETTLIDDGSDDKCKKEISIVKINNKYYIDRVYSL
jgi:hypothetical protein